MFRGTYVAADDPLTRRAMDAFLFLLCAGPYLQHICSTDKSMVEIRDMMATRASQQVTLLRVANALAANPALLRLAESMAPTQQFHE